jgi:uncharacterized membrane protein
MEEFLHVEASKASFREHREALPVRTTEAQSQAQRPPIPPPPPQPTHLPSSHATPRYASEELESRIGSHWLNRIGIAAVLIGVSFFLEYAFENNWIGPSARVVIGLFSGIAIVLWSERFRQRGYEIFSYSLKAVGIGVLYLSLWASFQVYHLLPSNLVFAARRTPRFLPSLRSPEV